MCAVMQDQLVGVYTQEVLTLSCGPGPEECLVQDPVQLVRGVEIVR